MGAAGAVLTLNHAAVARNWRRMGQIADAPAAAVVKADAYGTGIEPTGAALAEAECDTFFVAHASEGARLRAVAPGAAIYVLNGLFEGALDIYRAHDLRPVLGSREEIEAFSAHCVAVGRRLPAAIHVDTGMNRLGLDLAEAALVAEPGVSSLAFTPALLMSHLACADETGHPLTARQIDRFAQVRGLFPGVPGSLANSAGCLIAAARHDLVRPGVALYGGLYSDKHGPMEPVVTLQSPILQVREIRAGDSVGYGATWVASRASRIAIVSVGYADGYLRAASQRGGFSGGLGLLHGRPCPFAGRVSMDLIALDVTAVAGARRGDLVTLIGEGLSVDDVAARAGTIGYEILTSLGRRYERREAP